MTPRIAIIASLIVAAGAAQAQVPSLPGGGVSGFRGGYYFGGNFKGLTPGSSERLEGFELGLDMTVFNLPIVEFRLSPTVAFGRSANSGVDGDFYRIVANAKIKPPSQSWYVAFGTGYGFTSSNGGSFNTTSGALGQVTVGVEPSGSAGLKLYYELSWVFGDPQLTGIALDVGLRF